MLEKFAATEKLHEAYFTVWICALAPEALEDYTPAVELAQRAVARQSDDESAQQALGCILMRVGQLEEALLHLTATAERGKESTASPAYVWYFLALAHQAHESEEKARHWYEKAAEHTAARLAEGTTATGEPLSWNLRLTLELLQREAENVLNSLVETPQPPPAEASSN